MAPVGWKSSTSLSPSVRVGPDFLGICWFRFEIGFCGTRSCRQTVSPATKCSWTGRWCRLEAGQENNFVQILVKTGGHLACWWHLQLFRFRHSICLIGSACWASTFTETLPHSPGTSWIQSLQSSTNQNYFHLDYIYCRFDWCSPPCGSSVASKR